MVTLKEFQLVHKSRVHNHTIIGICLVTELFAYEMITDSEKYYIIGRICCLLVGGWRKNIKWSLRQNKYQALKDRNMEMVQGYSSGHCCIKVSKGSILQDIHN